VKDDRVFLLHIEQAIIDIQEFTREGHEAFLRDKKTQFAVVRSLEIIGEASKRVSPALKLSHPTVPWRAIASMHDRLIHDCFGVDLAIVWEVVRTDLVDLKRSVEAILHGAAAQ
jgi:uncharacterized protein with HEPN domain